MKYIKQESRNEKGSKKKQAFKLFEMKICHCLLTHVNPNLYDFLSSVEHKRRNFAES